MRVAEEKCDAVAGNPGSLCVTASKSACTRDTAGAWARAPCVLLLASSAGSRHLQQRFKRSRIDRPAKVVTLAFGASAGLQAGALSGRLDAFGHHPQMQAAAHGDDGVDQHRRAAGTVDVDVDVDVAHKGRGDFERVDRKPPQIAQAGMPGAEIIQCDLHAQVLEPVRHAERPVDRS